MSLSGLLLTGAFTLTQSPIEDVGNTMVQTVTSAVAEADRPDQAVSQGFTYYIDVDYNINNEVIHVPSSTIDNKDDSYGLRQFTVSNTTHPNPRLSLPTADNVLVPAGLVTASAGSGLTGSGTFLVTLTVHLSDVGIMTSSCSIGGSEVLAQVNEDPRKAQIVHWPTVDGTPLVEPTTADKLSDPINSTQLNQTYSDELAAINDKYNNQNMISAWSITIDGVTAETNNSLSRYAQDRGKAGVDAIFDAGQKIVCSATKEYSVSIEGYDNNSVLIASGTCYGVITQS